MDGCVLNFDSESILRKSVELMNAHTFPHFNPEHSGCVQFPFVRSYLRPKVQTEMTKGIGISNLMFTERIKENILGVEPDPSNAALLQIESTSVRMQQSVKGQLGIYILSLTRLVSFSHSMDTSFECVCYSWPNKPLHPAT